MSVKFSVPRGTADISPAEVPLWLEIEAKTRQISQLYGYREIRTPLFEETDLFARSMGQTSDVVQKQMLNLAAQEPSDSDAGKKKYSLRPENTASVVRSYIESSLDRQEHISKFFYVGPMFRGERPQKGRLRQFHQIGVEAIGPGTFSALLDAEVISLALHLLGSLGVENYLLKINSLGDQNDKKAFAENLRRQLKGQLKSLCPDCQGRYDRNVFRILDCKNNQCNDVVHALELDESYLSPESAKYYKEVQDALAQLGINFKKSARLVRGLDYYTHTVFEITSAQLGSQDALGAGGRYNNLVRDLGGNDQTPVGAVGFSLGVERIILSLKSKERAPSAGIKVFLVVLDNDCLLESFKILNALRQNGIASDISYHITALKSQMRHANKIGCPYVLIMGGDELKANKVFLKNMTDGTQEEIKLDNHYRSIIDRLKKS